MWQISTSAKATVSHMEPYSSGCPWWWYGGLGCVVLGSAAVHAGPQVWDWFLCPLNVDGFSDAKATCTQHTRGKIIQHPTMKMFYWKKENLIFSKNRQPMDKIQPSYSISVKQPLTFMTCVSVSIRVLAHSSCVKPSSLLIFGFCAAPAFFKTYQRTM